VRWWHGALGLTIVVIAAAVVWLPALGANGILHPMRRHVTVPTPQSCDDVAFSSGDVTLKGWRCAAMGPRRGVVVYLHGIADNRASGGGIVDRFVRRGFDVVAYDSRAHGESGGEACTYGVLEKADLSRVLDQLDPAPVAVIGTSRGGAVALQAAADDSRISAVVAAETFSDLRTVAAERAPFFFSRRAVAGALERAGRDGHFDVDAASPVAAAKRMQNPVFLVHGADDLETSPDHSRRIFTALTGPKRLVIVPGATHNTSLHGSIWLEIERWIADVLPPAGV
jgi:pimeloyl-ACP methyl ester carboxylesterase